MYSNLYVVVVTRLDSHVCRVSLVNISRDHAELRDDCISIAGVDSSSILVGQATIFMLFERPITSSFGAIVLPSLCGCPCLPVKLSAFTAPCSSIIVPLKVLGSIVCIFVPFFFFFFFFPPFLPLKMYIRGGSKGLG